MRSFAVKYPYRATGRPLRGLGNVRPRAALRALAGAVGLLAILGLTVAPSAVASSVSTKYYYVAPTLGSTATNTGCTTAGYTTVQSAVTAAEAYEAAHQKIVPTIELCPGTYTEQVTITRSLVLTRAKVAASQGPVTILLPSTVVTSTTTCQTRDAATSTQVPQSVIEICAANASGGNTSGVFVSISHVTVQGSWPTSVCYDSLYDVLVEGGASLSLTDSVVEQAGADPINGCQGGVGVEAGFSPTGQIGHIALDSDTVQSYQKNGITVDGAGSSAKIVGVTVTGAGPTATIAQNGIQISDGATGSVTGSTITGNNYTGTGEAFSTGILVYGGSSCSAPYVREPLVKKASITHNTVLNNDVGIALFNVNVACSKSASTPTRNRVCSNVIRNGHGYVHGVASADANISGYVTAKGRAIGDQAGVSDSGDKDIICDNAIGGIGYAARDKTSTLPNPAPPAWVRPIDLFSYAPALRAQVSGNTYDGKAYKPH